MQKIIDDEIRHAVRKHYGKVAETTASGRESAGSCCGSGSNSQEEKVTTSMASGSACAPSCCSETPQMLPEQASLTIGYSQEEITLVPEGANLGLGCGNPQAIASLKAGETVLDLGSGGGIDSFLAARQVGPSGQVIGVDMTPEMISKARSNAVKAQVNNVEFRLGEIEHLPVADGAVDVIISNCVINLSPSKESVFKEAYRVLKPGGRLAISDIVATAQLPEEAKRDLALYTGCMAGAALIDDLQRMLTDSGFAEIRIRPKDESKSFIREWAPGRNIEDYVVSATIEATKP